MDSNFDLSFCLADNVTTADGGITWSVDLRKNVKWHNGNNLCADDIIYTDISKDGAMQGTNRELYRELSEKFSVNITASGGVSSLDDIRALRKLDLYGAIVGKAYYNGAINLVDALEAAK